MSSEKEPIANFEKFIESLPLSYGQVGIRMATSRISQNEYRIDFDKGPIMTLSLITKNQLESHPNDYDFTPEYGDIVAFSMNIVHFDTEELSSEDLIDAHDLAHDIADVIRDEFGRENFGDMYIAVHVLENNDHKIKLDYEWFNVTDYNTVFDGIYFAFTLHPTLDQLAKNIIPRFTS